MALQTANQYRLVADASPLAAAVSEMMTDRRASQERQALAKQEMLRQNLKTTGAQLFHIRNNIEGKDAQKKAIAELGKAAAERGEDISTYKELLEIDDPDLLNTRMTQVFTRAESFLKKGESLGRSGDTKVLGVDDTLVSTETGETIAEGKPASDEAERPMKQDANGRWRYTDGNKEMVFSEVDKKLEERDPEKTFTQTKKLRDEFTKATDEFAKINNSYTRVISSAEDPSPAGDMALIFNYMKILDPGSAVREAEFKTAGQAGNLPTQVQQAYNKLAEGQLLTASMRKDFVNRAGRLYKGLEKNHKKREKEYIRIADSFDLDPSQVIIEQSVSDMPIEDAGPIGEIEEEKTVNGKRYQKIGGKWYGVE